jgi:cobalt/nickel transport system permease protein
MSNDALNALDALDRLAGLDTPVHRLDARVKLLAALTFIVAVVSFGKYEIAGLAPFALFPLLIAGLGNIPLGTLFKRSLLALPIALSLAAFNPWLDPEPMALASGWTLAAGWISLLAVGIKAVLAASAAVLLVATTSFPGLCNAMDRLGAPKAFTQQLCFLWRYAGVLADEAGRLRQARDQRSFGRGNGPAVAARLIGVLLTRALERAERIHAAMLCRGYNGQMPQRRQQTLHWGDALFLFMAFASLAACRLLPVTHVLGTLLLKGIA